MEGDTLVEGTGPPGVPIVILDVSLMGEPLGWGVISKDGNFAIKVNPPLQKFHQIGITLGDLEGTEFTPEMFTRGEEYRDQPMVGTLLDMATVLMPTRSP